ATVFQTFELFEAWWRVFGADGRLRVGTVFDGDVLVAVAPLMTCDVRVYGRTRTCLTFTGGMQTDYADFLYQDERGLGALVRALQTDLDWGLLDLGRIPASSATPRALAAAFPDWRGTVSISDIC